MLNELIKINRFKVAALATLATLIIYILITAFGIGGDDFVNVIGNLVPVIFSLLTTLFFLNAWTNAGNSVSKRIWGYIGLGLALWTIAEATWGYYSVILEREVPYPSLADLFWLVGYPLVYVGFFIRYRTLHAPPSNWQRNLLVLIAIIFALITFYLVVWPIIASFDPDYAVESILSIFYPFADFGLLILASLVLFSLEKGKHSSSWQLMLFGFFSMSISDLGFSYADWNGLYFPDGILNTLSFLIDTLYIIAYMAMALGIFASGLTPQAFKGIILNRESQPQVKNNILVYIDGQGRIIGTSDNISLLVDSRGKNYFSKMLLADALRLNSDEADSLIKILSTQGFVSNKYLESRDSDERIKNARVSGVAWKEDGKFTGATLVFQTLPAAEDRDEPPLSKDQEKLVEHTLMVSGTQAQEDSQALRTYYFEHVNLLYSLIDQFSGTRIANGLISQINQKAARENWNIVMEEGKVSISDEYGGQDLANILSELLLIAQKYTLNFVGLNVIHEEMGKGNSMSAPA